jgi:hypothetical protein
MIRPIDIRLNAAHPELPLAEAVTFTGSPSTVLIRGVPPNCGRWAITAVFVAATYPDGSTTTRAAVQSANGVWVATLPATARSGRTENGLRVLADGIDENGAAVTGYILGVADFAVASLGVTPAPEPGETSWQMLYFDAVPGTLRKGDVAKVDGVLKLYNGTAWEPFAGDIPTPSTATPAMDGTGAAGTSAAFARGDHVHPTDTSRMAANATGEDIPANSSGGSSIDEALRDIGTTAGQAATDATTALQDLAGKLDKSGGTFGATTISLTDEGIVVSDTQSSNLTLLSSSYNFLTHRDDLGVRYFAAPSTSGTLALAASQATAGNLAALDANGNPTDALIPAANVAVKGNIPYDRITITTGQLQDRAVQKVALNAATTTLSLPALTDLTGKVSDFGIDVVNGYEVSGTPTAASFSLAGTIGTDYNLIVPEGEDWSEMSALAAGEMAQFYFTLSAFSINDKPTWKIVKQVVELVPVPSAP